MPEKQQQDKDYPSNSPNPNKPEKAFLQVPTEIRDQVEAYILELTKHKNIRLADNQDIPIDITSQGCFLVISLEKIEQIIGGLQSCLSTEPDKGAENIKKQIRETLTLLR